MTGTEKSRMIYQGKYDRIKKKKAWVKASLRERAMSDKTYKNFFDDGYTTYHEDGSKSSTHKHLFDDGYTTYHEDGSKSTSYQHLFDDGYTTYHEDGSRSSTYKHVFDSGMTTYHDDGSKSTTYHNIFDDGYTTCHSGPYGGASSSGVSPSCGYGGGAVYYRGGSSTAAQAPLLSESSYLGVLGFNLLIMVLTAFMALFTGIHGSLFFGTVMAGVALSLLSEKASSFCLIRYVFVYIALVGFLFAALRTYEGSAGWLEPVFIVVVLAILVFLYYTTDIIGAPIFLAVWLIPRIAYALSGPRLLNGGIAGFVVIGWAIGLAIFTLILVARAFVGRMKTSFASLKREFCIFWLGFLPLGIIASTPQVDPGQRLARCFLAAMVSVILCGLVIKRGKYARYEAGAFMAPLVLYSGLTAMVYAPLSDWSTFPVSQWFFEHILHSPRVLKATEGMYEFYESFRLDLEKLISARGLTLSVGVVAAFFLLCLNIPIAMVACTKMRKKEKQ